ncbi:MAG: hypothetical protein JW787_00825 [Sedimentisphaerales bacterium]|nr:hypothetical protein [Sedimentisphaerales bacterium]
MNQNQNKKFSVRRYIIATVALLVITPVFVFIMLRLQYDPGSEAAIPRLAAIQLNKELYDLQRKILQ